MFAWSSFFVQSLFGQIMDDVLGRVGSYFTELSNPDMALKSSFVRHTSLTNFVAFEESIKVWLQFLHTYFKSFEVVLSMNIMF